MIEKGIRGGLSQIGDLRYAKADENVEGGEEQGEEEYKKDEEDREDHEGGMDKDEEDGDEEDEDRQEEEKEDAEKENEEEEDMEERHTICDSRSTTTNDSESTAANDTETDTTANASDNLNYIEVCVNELREEFEIIQKILDKSVRNLSKSEIDILAKIRTGNTRSVPITSHSPPTQPILTNSPKQSEPPRPVISSEGIRDRFSQIGDLRYEKADENEEDEGDQGEDECEKDEEDREAKVEG